MLPHRIERRVDRIGGDGCWIWTGALQPNGYGYTRWLRADGKWGHARTHRLFYEAYVGPIPDGMEIDHLCRVRECCNPAHLRVVTHAENVAVMDARGHDPWTHCKRGHEFTAESTYTDARGQRNCRICRTENVRRWRARQ